MKKKVLAMLLGGVMAVGALSVQVPVTAEAMTSDECAYGSDKHIKSCEVSTVDGQLTVTIDIEDFETRTSNGGVKLYAFEKELEKSSSGGVEDYPVYEQSGWAGELDIDKSGTYTFSGLAGGKTYYVYAVVYDLHGLQPSEDSGQHYATYLGAGTVSAPRTVVDCDGTFSDPHIKTSEVTAADGKIAVTIDLAIEYEEGFAELYVFENPVEASTGYGYVKDPVTSEWIFGEIEFYNVLLEASFGTPPAATMRINGGNNTYTFPELSADKTYHVYCVVYDWHEANGEGESGIAAYSHYAKYLGVNGSGSQEGSGAQQPAADGTGGTAARDIDSEAINSQISLIQSAEAGSTIALDQGTSTLSNAVMKELLKKGDVSLKLEFTYDEQPYVIVIPAGAALDNDIPWYGPLYLAQQYGNSAGIVAPVTSAAGGTYEVKRGDTLSKIAAANNMTLKQLLALNPQIKDANKIAAGQKINR